MIVLPVKSPDVYAVWNKVSQHIQSAFDAGIGEYTAEQAKVYLVQGWWQLFVVLDENSDIKGAFTVEYINRPNDRVAFVTSVGGKGITDREAFEGLKNMLRDAGATKIEGACRDSVLRLWKQKFKATEKCKIVEVRL